MFESFLYQSVHFNLASVLFGFFSSNCTTPYSIKMPVCTYSEIRQCRYLKVTWIIPHIKYKARIRLVKDFGHDKLCYPCYMAQYHVLGLLENHRSLKA